MEDENKTEEQIDSPSQEQLPLELEVEPENPSEPLLVEGSKKDIAKLLKKRKIQIGLILIGIFFLILFLFCLFSDSSETLNLPYKENSTCESVKVIYDPYNEEEEESVSTMDLESYVKAAMNLYAKEIQNPPDGMYNFYYALAIALRTEVIHNNCEVTYRDQQISNSSAFDSDLNDAWEGSKGIIVTDSDTNVLDLPVSSFCWSEEEDNQYHLLGKKMTIESDFVLEHMANEVYSSCECNRFVSVETVSCEENDDICTQTWASKTDEEENPIECQRAWVHQDDSEGFSVFGAFYVMMRYKKDYSAILRYFAGSDINLMTVSKEEEETDNTLADNTNCSDFSLTNTTLSKNEFVSRVQNYSDSRSGWKLFQENAGLIYDMGVENNVNPEIIMVRGLLEGFSPGGSTYNYFGIACYNESPGSCSRYASFEKGILAFIEVLQKYKSFTQFSGRYAYLGNYWFNPGSDGSGGCAYANDIYPDGLDSYVADACSPSRRNLCVAGETGTKVGCVPTRQEDKDAYALFQGKNMIELREKIFGISDSCYGSCVLYSQSDPRWGSDLLGNSSITMSKAGCAVTSVAIAMTCTGLIDDVSNFSPAVLNQAMKNVSNGFAGPDIYWDNAGITSFIPSFHVGGRYTFNAATTTSQKLDALTSGLSTRRMGIVHLSRGHFVVLQSVNQSNHTITALDPAGGKVNTFHFNEIDGFKYYNF